MTAKSAVLRGHRLPVWWGYTVPDVRLTALPALPCLVLCLQRAFSAIGVTCYCACRATQGACLVGLHSA